MKKKIIGIAGYAGSGKTTVGEYFESLGAEFIDADGIVDDLYKPGSAGYLKLVNYFGKSFLMKNREINRKKLAEFVFADENKLKILNNLIHPLVYNEIQKTITKSDADIVFIEAVYFDKKYLGRLAAKIIWVDCQFEKIKQRMQKVHGTDMLMIKKIVKIQKKPENIDFNINNSGSKEGLFKKLDLVWREINN